jgi:hypothetical protein
MRMYSAQAFSSCRSFSCACSGVAIQGSLATLSPDQTIY